MVINRRSTWCFKQLVLVGTVAVVLLLSLLLLPFPGCGICLELRPARIFRHFVYVFLAGFCKRRLRENEQRLSYFGC